MAFQEAPRLADGAPQQSLVQRVVLGVLHALLFFVVALYPMYQMASFKPDVHYTLFGLVAVLLYPVQLGVAALFSMEQTPALPDVHYTSLVLLAVVLGLYWAASRFLFRDA